MPPQITLDIVKTIKNYSDKLKSVNEKLLSEIRAFFLRNKAHKFRRKVVNKNGNKVVDRNKKRQIKKYSRQVYGSSSYWPWLALYTEIRGEFKKGWIPQDYYRFTLLKKYNPEIAIQVSEYKTLDYLLFPDFALKPLFMKIKGNFYSADGDLVNLSEIRNVLNNFGNDLVIKESHGWQGKQISFIHSKDFSVNQFSENNNFVAQPVLEQHKILRDVHPSSLNTIRVFTYLKDDGTPNLKFAVLRFGIDGSRVDNTSSGGGFTYINQNGYCEKWGYKTLGFKIGTKHPNTNIDFNSIKIPNYAEVLSKCLKSHKKFPYAKFVGWDVAVDIEGIPILIEWNTNTPTLWLSEALIGPLWEELPK